MASTRYRAAASAQTSDLTRLKAARRGIIDRHAQANDQKGLAMVASTLLPLVALVFAAMHLAERSYGLSVALLLRTSLLLVRAFVLMHECGHGSLFRSGRLNRGFGFVLGVLTGMPQFVWSQHHQFHHATNGNWDQYRGPLSIIRTSDYAALSVPQQRRYRDARSVWLAPLGGLMYVVVNPRLNWLKGSLGLLRHIARGRREQPGMSLGELARAYPSPHWDSWQAYRHMSWNNIALIGLFAVLSWLAGPALFLGFYLSAMGLAGGIAIAVFTVQHNFEHAYASSSEGWDYHRAALEGTSFLTLPGWLNWCTADIAYHHVHHLSARIPSYRLAPCHHENEALFGAVRRISLAQIPAALRCILWDQPAQRIVSVAEFEAQRA